MFDIEYPDRLADARRARNAKGKERESDQLHQLPRDRYRQLCELAKSAAERSWANWLTREKEKLAAKILRRGRSTFSVILATLGGDTAAKNQEDALLQAEAEIRSYESWQTNWQANEALAQFNHWLGVLDVSAADDFYLTHDDYTLLLLWSSR